MGEDYQFPSVSHCSYGPYSCNLQHLLRSCHHHSWCFRAVDHVKNMGMWSHMTRCSRIHDPLLLLLRVIPLLLRSFCVQGAVYCGSILGNRWGEHDHALFPILIILLFLFLVLLLGIFVLTLGGVSSWVGLLLAFVRAFSKSMSLCLALGTIEGRFVSVFGCCMTILFAVAAVQHLPSRV